MTNEARALLAKIMRYGAAREQAGATFAEHGAPRARAKWDEADVIKAEIIKDLDDLRFEGWSAGYDEGYESGVASTYD